MHALGWELHRWGGGWQCQVLLPQRRPPSEATVNAIRPAFRRMSTVMAFPLWPLKEPKANVLHLDREQMIDDCMAKIFFSGPHRLSPERGKLWFSEDIIDWRPF